MFLNLLINYTMCDEFCVIYKLRNYICNFFNFCSLNTNKYISYDLPQ